MKYPCYILNFSLYRYDLESYNNANLFIGKPRGNEIFNADDLFKWGIVGLYITQKWGEENKELLTEKIKQLNIDFV